MSEPNETVTLKCWGCSRQVRLPAARHRRTLRQGKVAPVFCSRVCNAAYVARVGTAEQKKP